MRGLLLQLHVHRSATEPTCGWLFAGHRRFRCALGAAGTTRHKQEGDKATPVATLALRRVWYRADRVSRPASALPLRRIAPDDGWCDDPADRRYNRWIKRPFTASHEAMWRDDHLYDLVVELGWNDAPPRPGRGSAIFMHMARPGYRPTEGCVALRPSDLRQVLTLAAPGAVMRIIG